MHHPRAGGPPVEPAPARPDAAHLEPARGARHAGEFDREIDVAFIVKFLVGLGIASVITVVLMYGLFRGMQKQAAGRDRPASPLVDRTRPEEPPLPHLQTAPERALAEFRAAQRAHLEGFGWVDERAGVARVPIDMAIDLLVARGVPVPPVAPQVAPPAARAVAPPVATPPADTTRAPVEAPAPAAHPEPSPSGGHP